MQQVARKIAKTRAITTYKKYIYTGCNLGMTQIIPMLQLSSVPENCL